MNEYRVAITQTITTHVFVKAENPIAARKIIEEYGIAESAKDMADNDEVDWMIKSVTRKYPRGGW